MDMVYACLDSSRLLAADTGPNEMGRRLEKEIRRADVPSVYVRSTSYWPIMVRLEVSLSA